MRTQAVDNRRVLIRLTLVFAVLSSLLVPFDELGAFGESLHVGLSVLLSSTYAGMVAALICLPGADRGSPDLWAAVRPVLARLIWATLIVTVVVTISIILIVVPFILATLWAVVVPVIVVEKTSAIRALPRSQQLVRGNGFRVFGFLICLALITVALMLFGLLLALPFGTGMVGAIISNFIVICVAYPMLTGQAVLYSELAKAKKTPAATEPAEL